MGRWKFAIGLHYLETGEGVGVSTDVIYVNIYFAHIDRSVSNLCSWSIVMRKKNFEKCFHGKCCFHGNTKTSIQREGRSFLPCQTADFQGFLLMPDTSPCQCGQQYQAGLLLATQHMLPSQRPQSQFLWNFAFLLPFFLEKKNVPSNTVRIEYFSCCVSAGLLLTNADAIRVLAEFFLFIILCSGNQMGYA